MLRSSIIRPTASLRRAAATLLASGALVVAAAPVLASHASNTVDCGAAGTYTIRAVQTAAGDHQAPEPASVIVFREGGALTVKEFWVNGTLRFELATNGRAQNAIEEVTCTFENDAGVQFQVRGVLGGA